MKLMTTLVHETRNEPLRVRFSDSRVYIDLADGRFVGAPLSLFPELQSASEAQRYDYQLYELTVCWEDLGCSIDLNAMLTGLYASPNDSEEIARLYPTRA